MRTQEVIIKQAGHVDAVVPIVTTWRGIKMIKSHSIRATVKEIVQFSKSLDVVKIGIIGNQHTGKSTMSVMLAHLIHTMSPIPFAIRVFDKESLLDFQATLKSLTPANYVLVFTDVSFMGATAGKKQIEMVKQAMTQIRHLPGGQDVKIITIMEYHYTLGLDKYLRQSDFRYFTSIGSSELENMERIVGSKYMSKILQFQRMYQKAVAKGFFSFRLGQNAFGYKYRNPFIPSLFFDNSSLRYVVSPTREWIDPTCSICDFASNPSMESVISADQVRDEGYSKFTPQVFKSALKHKLLLNGLTTYSSPIVQAERYIDRVLMKKSISLTQLADVCKLSLTKTRLDKKLEGVLDLPDIIASIANMPVQLPNEYPEYENWNYEQCVTELGKMAQLPVIEIDIPKYEYLNKKAREVGGI